MAVKGTGKNVRVPKGLKGRFDALPLTMSSAIKQAIMDANDNPQLLIKALQNRMLSTGPRDDIVRASYWADETIDNYCERLSNLSELPIEQVVRLAMEAYINKL